MVDVATYDVDENILFFAALLELLQVIFHVVERVQVIKAEANDAHVLVSGLKF